LEGDFLLYFSHGPGISTPSIRQVEAGGCSLPSSLPPSNEGIPKSIDRTTAGGLTTGEEPSPSWAWADETKNNTKKLAIKIAKYFIDFDINFFKLIINKNLTFVIDIITLKEKNVSKLSTVDFPTHLPNSRQFQGG